MSEIFTPRIALEMVVRGTAVYWFLYLMFRLVIRRRVGAVGMADILIVVIVADAIQNAMAGTYQTRVLQPPPLQLIRDGKLLWRHMKAEFISEVELREKLREHGITDYAEVASAHLESDGAVSVIRRKPPRASPG